MPIAQKFNSSGVGNGFPACFTKVDMTQPTSSATWAAPIINALTYEQVMSLYRNLYGMIGTATAIGSSDTSTQSDLNIPDDDTPHNRTCAGSYSDFREDSTGAPDFATTIQQVGVDSGIIAMYDGVTTDEDNFLGYAMGDAELPNSVAVCKANTSGFLEVQLFAGYIPATTDSDAWFNLSDIYIGTPPTVTNVTYQDIPFITAGLSLGSTTGLTATITDVALYTYPPA